MKKPPRPSDDRFPPRHYKGCYIVKHSDIYQVRWTQHRDNGEKLVHTWSPWCDSLNEAKAVIDKLVDRAEGFGWLHPDSHEAAERRNN